MNHQCTGYAPSGGMPRRSFLSQFGMGLGAVALSAFVKNDLVAEEKRGGAMEALHHPAKAKRVIFLFQSGGPSQIDLWDHKPHLNKVQGEQLPESIRKGQRLTTMTSGQKRFPIAPSIYDFHRYDNGGDGADISELLPYTGQMAKDIAIVRSVYTEAINHDPAITFIATGREQPGRPSLGSWLSYGLGAENQDLPAFAVMTPTWTGRQDAQALYNRLWGAGMLASKHSGVALRAQGDPVLFLKNPEGVDRASRRRMLDSLARMNARLQQEVGDPEIQNRIAQYELAYRMQSSVPQLTDLSGEPDSTAKMYGPDANKPGTFAASCVLARRMIERGVRFVQMFHRGWDQHFNLTGDLPKQCRDIDQPAWALVQDLKQRGLLDETLVIWGGEFGRTAYCQGKLSRENYGRDHHPRCFSMWMAGGGIQGGQVYGSTDDFSYNITKDPLHIRDFHATILHLLGYDHERFTVKYQGLNQRLTGVEQAKVVKELLA